MVDVISNLQWNDILDEEISTSEVRHIIKSLPNNKASGKDCLLYEMFKHATDVTLMSMAVLFSKIMQCGYYPKSWAEGVITLLHKNGPCDDLNNFRDITLLSCFGKVFEGTLCNRLVHWEEAYRVISESQAAFRHGYSTSDHIFTLQGLISKSFLESRKLYVAFID